MIWKVMKAIEVIVIVIKNLNKGNIDDNNNNNNNNDNKTTTTMIIIIIMLKHLNFYNCNILI